MKTIPFACVPAGLCLLVLFILQPITAVAEDPGKPIVIGQEVILHSKILDEDRALRISLPEGYDKEKSRYPVLFMLDGEFQFVHTAALTGYLSMFECAPKMIVVAIPNTDRARDLWPAVEKHDSLSRYIPVENSRRFLRFLEEELIPYVDTRYRTQPYRILSGHCLAGLFTLHAFMAEPDLFQAYMAITPYLLFGDKLPTPFLEPFLAQHPDMERFLYITQGDESDEWVAGTEKFVALLKAHAPPGLAWHYERLHQEGHGTEILKSLKEGLETLYHGWRMPDDMVTRGRLAVEGHFAALSERFGFQVPIPEKTCNLLGYTLLKEKKVEEAIQVFERNVAAYPESWNVYDSLGEAYMTAGEKEKAVQLYKKSLALNPDNENGRAMLEKLGRVTIKSNSL